jgi:hypothetical protein
MYVSLLGIYLNKKDCTCVCLTTFKIEKTERLLRKKTGLPRSTNLLVENFIAVTSLSSQPGLANISCDNSSATSVSNEWGEVI